MAQRDRFIVTGGGGFLGKAIATRLVSEGHEVISVSRGDYPQLQPLGIRHVRLDLAGDVAGLADLFKGARAVFHVAAKVDMWGPFEEFFRANVLGTRNVIEACKAAGVKSLIFTSSPSVVADGKDLNNVNESYPYPSGHLAFYPQTKAQAEREVLAANGQGGLKTVALRPHLIFGPGDTNLVPTVLAKARAGRLLRIGAGENRTDLTFIEDCVEAHICALRALEEGDAASGRAYFISQSEPVNLWGWVDRVLKANELPVITRNIPTALAKVIAFAAEKICGFIPGNPEPFITRFLVCEMSTSHYFDISAARRDLGFSPKNSVDQAMKKTFG